MGDESEATGNQQPAVKTKWWRRLRWIDWIYLLVLASFVWFVLDIALTGPVNRVHNWLKRDEFDYHREKWESSGITHYRYDPQVAGDGGTAKGYLIARCCNTFSISPSLPVSSIFPLRPPL